RGESRVDLEVPWIQVVQTTQVFGSSRQIVELILPQIGPIAKQLSNLRSVENFAERSRSDLFRKLVVARRSRNFVECGQRVSMDELTQGVTNPTQRSLGVAQLERRQPRCTAQHA